MKKVFISYSWDSENHKEWVVSLSNKLRQNGVNAELDEFDIEHSDLNAMMVNKIQYADKIIIVITPNYTAKANAQQGGVGFETKLMYQTRNMEESKIIPIIREWAELPFYISNFHYIDFTKYSDSDFNKLLLRINDSSEYIAMPVSNEVTKPIQKTARGLEDFDNNIIPDLHVLNEKDVETYANKLFIDAINGLDNLLELTKSRNPNFLYSKNVDCKTSNICYPNNSDSVQVYTYEVSANGKSNKYSFWVRMNEKIFTGGMKGIFGSECNHYMDTLISSWNFQVSITIEKNKIVVKMIMPFFQNEITNKKDLSKAMYEILMQPVKI